MSLGLVQAIFLLTLVGKTLGTSVPPADAGSFLPEPTAQQQDSLSFLSQLTGLVARGTKSGGSRTSKSGSKGNGSSNKGKLAAGGAGAVAGAGAGAAVGAGAKAADDDNDGGAVDVGTQTSARQGAVTTKYRTKAKTRKTTCTPRPSASSSSTPASSSSTGASTTNSPAGPTSAPSVVNALLDDGDDDDENWCDNSAARSSYPNFAVMGLITALPIAVGVYEFW